MAKPLAIVAALCLAAVAAADEKKKSDEKVEPAGRAGEKWEYAELHYTAAREARGGRGGGGFGGGGQGVPGGMPAVVAVKAKAQWVTGDGEVEGDSWADLAAKLKAPAAAKDARAAAHKIKLLNYLGSQGWEMVSSTTNTWTFKRKVAR